MANSFVPYHCVTKGITIGIVVLIFLGLLFALVYSLKRDYWKEVH